MMKKFLMTMICCMVGALGLHAYSAKGMVTYKKLCKQCHGSGFKGAAMLTSDEWEEMFEYRAAKLKKVHEVDAEAKKVIDSGYFKRNFETLGKFLRNNGSDMGVVRSCDGMNCG
ncbi:hypothetical protein [Hydrogenimonas cancrithermarum]|uniref:Cytochrome c domain-containing protein n=1 Tax=Hydrogenimonas cancrithermarum TaxID=2993563 RepID=A0ABM8FKM4_9BACT|nr:hypothetical protein [Hydrogenimonas cancrithermarum]BDY12231.1 hypothetical protein HCR_05430 [Hydrogenimonas cancrithermarum]